MVEESGTLLSQLSQMNRNEKEFESFLSKLWDEIMVQAVPLATKGRGRCDISIRVELQEDWWHDVLEDRLRVKAGAKECAKVRYFKIIDGKSLDGRFSSLERINWLNKQPDYQYLKFVLSW